MKVSPTPILRNPIANAFSIILNLSAPDSHSKSEANPLVWAESSTAPFPIRVLLNLNVLYPEETDNGSPTLSLNSSSIFKKIPCILIPDPGSSGELNSSCLKYFRVVQTDIYLFSPSRSINVWVKGCLTAGLPNPLATFVPIWVDRPKKRGEDASIPAT